MSRLALALYFPIATTLMGIGITAVLSLDMVAPMPILAAVAAGLVLGVPVSWLVAKQIVPNTGGEGAQD